MTDPHFIDIETWPRLTEQVDGGPEGEFIFCPSTPVTMQRLTSGSRKPDPGTR